MMSGGREKRSSRGGESQVSQGSGLRNAVVAKVDDAVEGFARK